MACIDDAALYGTVSIIFTPFLEKYQDFVNANKLIKCKYFFQINHADIFSLGSMPSEKILDVSAYFKRDLRASGAKCLPNNF